MNRFVGALLLGIWATILFFGKDIGLSMILFIVPFIYILIKILKDKQKINNKNAKILILPIILLSSTYFFYNNKFLNILNLFVIPILILILILELFEKDLEMCFLIENINEIIFTPISYLDITIEKIKEFFDMKIHIRRENNNILKAILVAIPVVMFVIILLSTADDIFGNIFINIIENITLFFENFNFVGIIGRIILVICIFLYLSSFFDNLACRYEVSKADECEKFNNEDNTTVKIILGALNIIYIVFCFIQIKSLFMKVDIENYSSYARKGFFQLMIVSLINFVMILIAKNYVKSKNNKFVNIMSIIMIICTFIILVSAGYRMYLYENAYGYTLLRLLVYITLFTETILLVPTIIYVIDKPINLKKSYFVIIMIVYVGINFLNLDNIIAENNVDRYFKTGKLDVYYLKNETGTDAIKQLKRIVENDLPNEESREIQEKIKEYIIEVQNNIIETPMDFRDFNLSKFMVKNIF